jgi:hypothetical protein
MTSLFRSSFCILASDSLLSHCSLVYVFLADCNTRAEVSILHAPTVFCP